MPVRIISAIESTAYTSYDRSYDDALVEFASGTGGDDVSRPWPRCL